MCLTFRHFVKSLCQRDSWYPSRKSGRERCYFAWLSTIYFSATTTAAAAGEVTDISVKTAVRLRCSKASCYLSIYLSIYRRTVTLHTMMIDDDTRAIISISYLTIQQLPTSTYKVITTMVIRPLNHPT